MKLVPITTIEVRKRQRTDLGDTTALNELAESILGRGLLHPPVCWPDGERWVLTAGGHRFAAIQRLNAMTPPPSFHCGDAIVPPGMVPITPLSDYLDELGRFEAELDENIFRADLNWQDRARALSDLHEARLKANPKQTLRDTGKELETQGVAKVETGPSGSAGAARVREAQIIARHLHNPKIAQARNATEALSLIYKREEERAISALVKRRLAEMPSKPLVEIRQGDLNVILPVLAAQSYDLIIADPPYGIDASAAGFRSRTVLHHNYEDTPEAARSLARCILTEGFRITKSRANIFVFCDIDIFDWLKRTAANMGWVPFRRPLIWQKSESEGLAPWGAQGPRITTEFIFFATKGQRGLNASPIDVFTVRRVGRTDRTHAAEKPVELMAKLIECATLPGDSILDPCCGSGSALVAAKALKRTGLGIEIDNDFYNTATSNVHGSGTTGTAA
jgi:site-specific DNA-methyltransferase (adenine-specific)